MLKFGRAGQPHEKVLTLSKDNRYLVWIAEFFCLKFGKECEGHDTLNLCMMYMF